MTSCLEIKGGSVIYLEGTPFVARALDSINFKINPREIIGLIGSTGSGKSTLVQALNGLVPFSEGDLSYPESYDPKKPFQKIGLVFQQPEDQLFERSVEEDVGFGPRQLGCAPDEIRCRVEKALMAVGLEPEKYFHRNPLELSGGEKRRVAIAGILSMEPEFLILDEPTAGLDQMGRDILLQSIRNLHEKNSITLLIISHDMDLLSRLATRLVVLHRGKIVGDGKPLAVFRDREILSSAGLRPPVSIDVLNQLQDLGLEVEVNNLSAHETASVISRALKTRK